MWEKNNSAKRYSINSQLMFYLTFWQLGRKRSSWLIGPCFAMRRPPKPVSCHYVVHCRATLSFWLAFLLPLMRTSAHLIVYHLLFMLIGLLNLELFDLDLFILHRYLIHAGYAFSVVLYLSAFLPASLKKRLVNGSEWKLYSSWLCMREESIHYTFVAMLIGIYTEAGIFSTVLDGASDAVLYTSQRRSFALFQTTCRVLLLRISSSHYTCFWPLRSWDISYLVNFVIISGSLS